MCSCVLPIPAGRIHQAMPKTQKNRAIFVSWESRNPGNPGIRNPESRNPGIPGYPGFHIPGIHRRTKINPGNGIPPPRGTRNPGMTSGTSLALGHQILESNFGIACSKCNEDKGRKYMLIFISN